MLSGSKTGVTPSICDEYESDSTKVAINLIHSQLNTQKHLVKHNIGRLLPLTEIENKRVGIAGTTCRSADCIRLQAFHV